MKNKFAFLLNAEPTPGGGGAPPTAPVVPPPGASPSVAPIAPATPGTPPTEPTPSTPPTSAIGADGTLGENWFLALGDQYSQAGDDLGKHKSLQSLIDERNYFRTKNGIQRPGEDATPDQIQQYRSDLGIPAAGTAEAYGLNTEGLSEAEIANYDRLAKVYHDNHGTPEAFNAAVAEMQAIEAEALTAWEQQQEAAVQQAQDELVQAWGADFEAKSSTARHFATRLAEAAGITAEDPTLQALVNTPAFSKIMLEVSKLTAEDSTSSPAGLTDFRSAQQRVEAITSGKDPQWGEKYLNGDIEAYNVVVSLQKQAKK